MKRWSYQIMGTINLGTDYNQRYGECNQNKDLPSLGSSLALFAVTVHFLQPGACGFG
jgi:hypothetical protein